MSRVVVVLRGGNLVKVCDDRDAFDDWMEQYSSYDKDSLTVLGARVYEKA